MKTSDCLRRDASRIPCAREVRVTEEDRKCDGRGAICPALAIRLQDGHRKGLNSQRVIKVIIYFASQKLLGWLRRDRSAVLFVIAWLYFAIYIVATGTISKSLQRSPLCVGCASSSPVFFAKEIDISDACMYINQCRAGIVSAYPLRRQCHIAGSPGESIHSGRYRVNLQSSVIGVEDQRQYGDYLQRAFRGSRKFVNRVKPLFYFLASILLVAVGWFLIRDTARRQENPAIGIALIGTGCLLIWIAQKLLGAFIEAV